MVLYYKRLPDAKFMAFDISFRDLEGIREEEDRRLGLLETVGATRGAPGLPRLDGQVLRPRARMWVRQVLLIVRGVTRWRATAKVGSRSRDAWPEACDFLVFRLLKHWAPGSPFTWTASWET